MLREYQKNAVDAAIQELKRTIEPCVIEAATGAGKSHMVAAIAEFLNGKTDKKVLVVQPTKELVEQNAEKYSLTGSRFDIWCASIRKGMNADVIFGTPKSIKNSIDFFVGKVSGVIIDECHRIDPTTKSIIESLYGGYERLRVVGFTATPYRMNTGYIYRYDQFNKNVDAIEPFFHRCVYSIKARELIAMGFLVNVETPPDKSSESYHTKGIELQKNGRYLDGEIKEAFESDKTKTTKIIDEVIQLCKDRKGVVIFASTINHAGDIFNHLKQSGESAALITGETKKHERARIIHGFKQQKIKYIVNVSVLTTGFDAPHVDAVVLMRLTESASLLQQIIGRGLRLCEGKNECWLLDYSENIERHFPDGDVFNPKIESRQSEQGEKISATCELCNFENAFTARKNDMGYEIDDFGYFTDLNKMRIQTDYGDFPAHFGRRCTGYDYVAGKAVRCNYRWTFKECPECDHKNDIAARRCESCGFEIIDPGEKLRRKYAKIKKDPSIATSDKVIAWNAQRWKSKVSGKSSIRIDYTTNYRSFPIWYRPGTRAFKDLCKAVYDEEIKTIDEFFEKIDSAKMPTTIKTRKEQSGFFAVSGHNLPED